VKKKCKQCEDPNLKGMHTCEKRRRPADPKLEEERMLVELQTRFSYMFQEPRKSERSTMIFERNRATGKSLLKPAVVVKLVVPADSWLGAQVVEQRKKQEASKGVKRAKS